MKSIGLFLNQYQTPKMKILHIHIVIFVILEILISYGMKVNRFGIIPEGFAFFTWLHILLGLFLLFFTPYFLFVCFQQRGFRYYYPYLWLDFKQISDDLKQLCRFKLPDSSPKGLAAVVQGLGLGALILVILSGTFWFTFWLLDLSMANEIKRVHKMLTTLIEIYIIGHGVMGVLHYLLWRKKSN